MDNNIMNNDLMNNNKVIEEEVPLLGCIIFIFIMVVLYFTFA